MRFSVHNSKIGLCTFFIYWIFIKSEIYFDGKFGGILLWIVRRKILKTFNNSKRKRKIKSLQKLYRTNNYFNISIDFDDMDIDGQTWL